MGCGWKYEFRGKTYKTILGLVKAAHKDNPLADSFYFDVTGRFCARRGAVCLPYQTVRYHDKGITAIA